MFAADETKKCEPSDSTLQYKNFTQSIKNQINNYWRQNENIKNCSVFRITFSAMLSNYI